MAALRMIATTLCLLACSAALSSVALADDPLPRAKPEDVGFSSERLARIGATLKADIEAGRIPGAVIAIARRGKLVALDAYGWRDKAAGVAMTTDTIFNIASMTKPMTAVGRPDAVRAGQNPDRRSPQQIFPEIRRHARRGARCQGEPTAETVPANRQITIQDLMRHTSGIVYGGRGNTLVHKMYPAGSSDASRNYDGAAFIDKLASAPLLYQPGDRVGLRFRPRRARPHHRTDQQAAARAISAGQSVRAARDDRYRVLGLAGQGGALRHAVAGRSRHRQAAGAQPGADTSRSSSHAAAAAPPPLRRTICALR